MKKKQENVNGDLNKNILEMVHGKKIPILVLDERWHKLFPNGKKPPEVLALESSINNLLKEQGKLVQLVKNLKVGKKKLMSAIVATMNESGKDRKKDKQQKLLLETNERIENESNRLMELPYEIREYNERLLVVGMTYCYNALQERMNEKDTLTLEIESMREEIKQKIVRKTELDESVDATYLLMHTLLGHEVMDLFDTNQ